MAESIEVVVRAGELVGIRARELRAPNADDDPLSAFVKLRMEAAGSATDNAFDDPSHDLDFTCMVAVGKKTFPGGLVEERPVVSKTLPPELAQLAAAVSRNHGSLKEEHLEESQRVLWTLQRTPTDREQWLQRNRLFLHFERFKADHSNCEPVMGGAVVEFVRPIPGNPNSTRVRCRIFYPHGCKGKDAIVPNLRIRLRPCDAQEAVVGSTGIVESVHGDEHYLIVELFESKRDFEKADIYLEESFYVWNCQMRALDDADDRLWELLHPDIYNQVDRLGYGFAGYAVSVAHQESTAAYVAERQGFLDDLRINHSSLRLDDQQKEAVYAIANRKYPQLPFVLHGPPGTGKTDVIYNAVTLALVNDQSNNNVRVLICTQANGPADVITQRVIEAGVVPNNAVFRMYSLSQQLDAKRNKSLDSVVYVGCSMPVDNSDTIADWKQHWQWEYTPSLQRDGKNPRYGLPPLHDIEQRLVVVCTTATAAYLVSGGIKKGHFSHIIIDEAGQATTPEVLVPLSLAGDKTKVVFCGDHKQRGPVINQHILERFGFTVSPLEQVLQREGYSNESKDERMAIMLTKSYGCCPEIVELCNPSYGGRLTAIRDSNVLLVEDLYRAGVIPKDYPVTFDSVEDYIDASGTRQLAVERRLDNQFSHDNLAEAIKVYKLVRRVLASLRQFRTRIGQTDIGVIALYKNQVSMIRKMLRKYPDIVIDSVERYQGARKKILIVSTVRTTDLGFVACQKRYNTAITRAMEVLIVVGCRNTLYTPHKPHAENPWTMLIDQCDKNHGRWDSSKRKTTISGDAEIERALEVEVQSVLSKMPHN